MSRQAAGMGMHHRVVVCSALDDDGLIVGEVDETGGVYVAVRWGLDDADKSQESVCLDDAGRKELIRLLGGTV